MKLYIREDFIDLTKMARIGFVPIGSTNTVEVYVHTNDGGNVPHFHVRKYGKNGQFEWETCIRYDSATYFKHGKYTDELLNRKIAKELDKMLRTIDKKDPDNHTYWQIAIIEWNRNNSGIDVPYNTVQPDYNTL